MSSSGAEAGLRTTSVVNIRQAWFVICTSKALKKQPLSRVIHDLPVVVFRDEQGRAGVLLDRCPHRNVSLSGGSVNDGCLQCPYHGWAFDRDGACQRVPGLAETKPNPARNVTAFPTREHDGYIWVWTAPDVAPESEPFAVPKMPQGYTTVRYDVEAQGTLHGTIENALDVPHTAYLHGGLFRSEASPKNTIRARVRRTSNMVEAEYLDEPRPPGLAARLLAPSGGTMTHFDRFLLPSISQVEYRIGTESHILITSLCTPVSDFQTKLYAIVQFRLGLLPGFVVAPFLFPIALRIFGQDARILANQTAQVHRFGEERFVSTEIDVLGAQILRLMRAAAQGRTDLEPYETEVSLVV